MKIMPTSRDDMVIPKVIDAVWHIVRLVDWRVPLVWMLLAISFLFTYNAFKGGLMWLEIMAADDPLKYPGAYGAMIGDGLAFLSLGLITLAGVTSAAWARHVCLPAFDARKVATRLLLAIHFVELSVVHPLVSDEFSCCRSHGGWSDNSQRLARYCMA
jgi:hypothetical protein